MKTFAGSRLRKDAVVRLNAAGWIRRDHQTGGDFEDFVRSSFSERHDPAGVRLLMVDFDLGRFILSQPGKPLLSHESEADGDPTFDAILSCLFLEKEGVEA
jgi:hypothetical protein